MTNKLKTFPVISIIIVTLLSIYAQSIPLLNILHYEYSAFFAIVFYLFLGSLTVYYLRKFKTIGVFLHLLITQKWYFISILIIPLFVAVTANIVFQICPFGEGILFYLVISIPAGFIGIVFGLFSYSINKKYSYWIFLGLFSLWIIIPISEFYFNPQIYFYNIVIGFYPGTIYDEDISLDSKLLLYRFISIFFTSSLLILTIKLNNRKKNTRILFNIVSIILIIILVSLKPHFSFSSTTDSIQNKLHGKAISPNYIMFYDATIKNYKKQLILLEHEYFFHFLKKEIQLEPDKKICTFIFKDGNQKRKLFGTKSANVAKPWSYQIYLDQFSDPSTIKHELIHIFASEIGSTPLKIASGFNFALLEGYATAIENDANGYDIDYLAYIGVKNDYQVDITNLFSKLNFFANAPTLSYIYAGSFLKFLINEYGINNVNRIYQDLDFKTHTGIEIDSLAKNYYSYINSLDYPVNKSLADFYFGRLPLIRKTCARKVANDLNGAWALFSQGKYYLARKKFMEVYNYSNSYSSLFGIINSNVKLNKAEESLNLLEEKMSEYKGTSSYPSALLNYANQLALTDRLNKADSIYSMIADMSTTPRYKNLAHVRTKIVGSEKNLIKKYLKGSDLDKYEILKLINVDSLFEPSVPIIVELSKRLDEDVEFLSSYLSTLKNLDERITSNTAFVLAEYYYSKLMFEEALDYAELSINKCNQSYRIGVLERFKERIRWIAENQIHILSNTKLEILN